MAYSAVATTNSASLRIAASYLLQFDNNDKIVLAGEPYLLPRRSSMVRISPTPQKALIEDIIEPVLNFLKPFISGESRKMAVIPHSAGRQFQDILDAAGTKLNKVYEQVVQQVDRAYDTIIRQIHTFLNGTRISIEVETQQLRFAAKGKIIPAKIRFCRAHRFAAIEVDCSLSCAHLEKLGDLRERTVNIMDHLDKLLPNSSQSSRNKGPIGLVTYQNGIMNKYDDEFYVNFKSVVEQFPEGTLCIGLYNKTTGILPLDMARFADETCSNDRSCFSLLHMILTLSDLLPKINPNLVWAHFAHSEAGLIANATLDLCNSRVMYRPEDLKTAKDFIKNQLVIVTYGAVKPIPDDHVLHVINTYTDKDIALTLGKKYIDANFAKSRDRVFNSVKYYEGKKYTIKVVKTELKTDPFLGIELQGIPEIQSMDQARNMSWMEWMVHREYFDEGSPRMVYRGNKILLDGVNAKAFAVQDHGFSEVTYQGELANDIRGLKKDYKGI